jgi:adenylate kinase
MITRALDLVLLGPPGAGKGTQARRLAAAFELLHVSTGDLLRDEVARGTALGQQAAEIMNRGELVSDELVGTMLMNLLHTQPASLGCVYDGYPRTSAQAALLDRVLSELVRRVDAVLYLAVPDESVLSRMSGRRSCPACGSVYHVTNNPPQATDVCDGCGGALVQRRDDQEATVAGRLNVFHERTAPLLGLYRDRGVLVEVDGVGSVDEVFARARLALQRVRR